MITGLVYTEVEEHDDPMAEVLRVKRSLAREVESVTRMQIRNSVNPKTAHANHPARSLLLSMLEMENTILALERKNADQDDALKEEREARHEALKAERQAREEAINAEGEAREEAIKAEREVQRLATEALCRITEEVTMLRPLKATAIDIRQRFFATFRRKEDSLPVDDRLIIHCGTLRAHAGDVVLDVCLFKNHLICSDETFSTLFGVSWVQAEELLGMLVYSPTLYKTICSSNRDRQ